MWRKSFFSFIVLCLFSEGVAFEVSPQRIFLSKEKMTDSLEVRNAWERNITVQITLFRWRQDDVGKCIYEETKDIVFYPKIFKLAAKEKRIVRIGAKVRNPDVEQTYRLYIEEIPVKGDAGSEPKSEGQERKMGFRILMRYGVPIFVLPEKEKHSLEVEEVRLRENILFIKIKNSSNVHLMIKRVEIKGYDKKEELIFEDKKAGWYLLAFTRKEYEFSLKEKIKDKLFYIDIAISTDKIDFKMRLHEGEIKVDN